MPYRRHFAKCLDRRIYCGRRRGERMIGLQSRSKLAMGFLQVVQHAEKAENGLCMLP